MYLASIVGNWPRKRFCDLPERLAGRLRLALRDFMNRKKADMQDAWW
ncbi:hypothetical protein MEA186_30387 [Mesorhizobium amorphae CCNWGS0123]|uniref:Uncharacterized protein n=1 Tax=Mesorhizobium amorphae CCNWGS0123 TaxID=1082933 RepID=G6YJA0_9HYPH|nr:hypothetical protein MEA186_30387 [Mesorhizobium amorphae CCNWGS0123]